VFFEVLRPPVFVFAGAAVDTVDDCFAGAAVDTVDDCFTGAAAGAGALTAEPPLVEVEAAAG
jgi:hypothetical protein